MKDLFTVVIVVCASSFICTLASTFITDGSTKKIVNLVLGAFIICSLIMPVKNAFSTINTDMSDLSSAEETIASSDEAYSREILSRTTENLENAAEDILLQNNIKINSCKIILAQTEENRIIISTLSIYISKEYVQYTELISSIIEENFGVSPSIMTE